jgi:hypothetical protein
MQAAKPGPARLSCGLSGFPGCKSSLEFVVMNDAPQRLEEGNGEDNQANNWMRIGKKVDPVGRHLANDPYAQPSRNEVDKICGDLACGVKLEDDWRLDVETEEDGTNGHQDNPSESCKNRVNDDVMFDILQPWN